MKKIKKSLHSSRGLLDAQDAKSARKHLDITRKMGIEEILTKYPDKSEKLSEILFSSGLNCVGCAGASFENLEQGMMIHGMSKKDQQKLIDNLNKVLKEKEKLIKVEITFTDIAAAKCKVFRKSPEHFFKITPLENLEDFNFKFIEKLSKDEISIENKGIKIALNKKYQARLNNAKIDYIQGTKRGYFKILIKVK
jgi:hybrid cluster-associated redox disulfide protein